jgi:hypothetical protein
MNTKTNFALLTTAVAAATYGAAELLDYFHEKQVKKIEKIEIASYMEGWRKGYDEAAHTHCMSCGNYPRTTPDPLT